MEDGRTHIGRGPAAQPTSSSPTTTKPPKSCGVWETIRGRTAVVSDRLLQFLKICFRLKPLETHESEVLGWVGPYLNPDGHIRFELFQRQNAGLMATDLIAGC